MGNQYIKQGIQMKTTTLGNEKILEYKSMVHKVEHMISEIKEAGFETLKFEDILRKIKLDILSPSFQSIDEDAFNNDKLLIDYMKALEGLKKLEKMLATYNMYAKAISTCRYVATNIDKDINLEEIKYYANLMIMVLKNIKELDACYIDDEDKINKEIYEVAYNVIKLEIMITGKSEIYEYAKSNSIDGFIFDKLVLEDLNEIDLEKTLMIKRRLYEIKSMGIDTSYFDLELIKLIMINKDNGYKERIVLRLEDILSSLDENKNTLSSWLDEVEDITFDIKDPKKENLRCFKNLTMRILSLFLGACLFVVGGYFCIKYSKKPATYGIYRKDALVYEDLTETLSTSSSEVELFESELPESNKKVTVTVYGSWNTNKNGQKTNRKVEVYDLSKITLDSIYDYVNESLLTWKTRDEVETVKYDYVDDDKYSQEYIEVECAEYTYLDKDGVSKTDYIAMILASSVGYLVLTFIMYFMFTGADENCLCFDEIFYDINYDINYFKDRNRKEMLLKVKKKLKEMLDIIYANEERKLEFTKLFEENKYLLNDPEELMKRFNELKDKQINDKVRTLSKKYGVK